MVSLGHPGGISSQLEQSGEIVMLRSLPVGSSWSLNAWRLDFFLLLVFSITFCIALLNTSYQLSHLVSCPMNGTAREVMILACVCVCVFVRL